MSLGFPCMMMFRSPVENLMGSIFGQWNHRCLASSTCWQSGHLGESTRPAAARLPLGQVAPRRYRGSLLKRNEGARLFA